MSSFVTVLLTFGGLAGAAVLVSKLLGGDMDIRKMLTDLFKKKSDEQIREVDSERKDIAKKVMASEKIADEKKQKVQEIKERAKKEIVDTLEKDDLAELVMESDDLWGK